MAISKVKRRNKPFILQQFEEIPDPTSVIDKIFDWLVDQRDGATFGEIYKQFPYKSPRYLRELVRNLKDRGWLEVRECRCHGASIYYAKCPKCFKSREGVCKRHQHHPNPWS